MKKLIALLLALVMVLGLVACGAKEDAPAADAPAADAPAADAPAADAPEADAPADEPIRLGLCNINEKGSFGKLVKYGFEQACAERGWTLLYMDNNSNGQTAVANAEMMVLQEPDFVVDMNVDASVGQTIMDIFNNAGIPVLAVDIALPGAPFFGIDSDILGYFNGEFAADYIKEEYNGEVDYVVLITQIASGDEVQKRVRSCVRALDDQGIKYGELVELEGENDVAKIQQRFTDFLTGHPDADRIIVFGVNENAGQGLVAAADTAGRSEDVRIFTVNVGAPFSEHTYATKGNTSWVGSVSNFTELYGEQCCDLIADYLENGTPLADSTCCKFEVITWDNINEMYPEDNLPWEHLN